MGKTLVGHVHGSFAKVSSVKQQEVATLKKKSYSDAELDTDWFEFMDDFDDVQSLHDEGHEFTHDSL